MSEVESHSLWHGLYLERKHAELIHHPRHTVRHHAEVFGTYEHSGRLGECREFLHCFFVPEHIVAAEEVVVVETHECFLLVCRKRVIHKVLVGRDARVIERRILSVWHEEHARDERVESFTKADIVLVCLFCKSSLYLSLSSIFVLHVVAAVGASLQVESLDEVGAVAEYALQCGIGDVWASHVLSIEVESVALYLAYAHRHGWRELTEQSMYGVHRYLPDAEESEYMVYAVCVEVFCHLAESALPPLVAVLSHYVPVVGRESPVLTVGREVVRWCSCLSVEVE